MIDQRVTRKSIDAMIKILDSEREHGSLVYGNPKFRRELEKIGPDNPNFTETERNRWLGKQRRLMRKWDLKGEPPITRIHLSTPVIVEKVDDPWLTLKINTSHPLQALLDLIAHEIHREKQKRPQRRRRSDKWQQQSQALALLKKGFTPRDIAKELFAEDYEKALPKQLTPEQDEKFRELARKYWHPPHNMNWPDAEKRAERELGVDSKKQSSSMKKLIERVRYWVTKAPKQK